MKTAVLSKWKFPENTHTNKEKFSRLKPILCNIRKLDSVDDCRPSW